MGLGYTEKWKTKVVLRAPCGAKFEFTGDVAASPVTHSELAVRFRDFMKAIGFDPKGWSLDVFTKTEFDDPRGHVQL